MLNENRLYSISLGVASLQDGLVGVATALSPAMAGHFKFLLHHFFVRLGLVLSQATTCAWPPTARRIPETCSAALHVPSCRRTQRRYRKHHNASSRCPSPHHMYLSTPNRAATPASP